MKDKVNKAVTSTKRVASNGERFVQATALLVGAAFNVFALRELELHRAVEFVVLGALVVVGLRGAVEVFKFLDRE